MYGTLILVVLILLDFVVFGFKTAVQSLNQASVEKLQKEGKKGAGLLLCYMDRPDRYMHVCQLLMLAVHTISGFLMIPFWKRFFLDGSEEVLISVFVTVLIFAAVFVLVLTIGIYTPEKVAARKPEAWAMALAGPVHALEILFFPAVFLMDAGANLLSRLFGVDPLADTDDVTEEEIISMVNEGHEQGMLLASEAEMIHNIFEFGDKEARDIMTHRKNIIALDGTLTFLEMLGVLKEHNYSRFPVYLDDIDNIIGVLHIKEALSFSQETGIFDRPVKEIGGLVREVDFIPETRNINTLFTMMQMKKSHMVIVVDEYGQTCGIVAMEDILEEIVGNIEDEHDEEEMLIERRTDGSYLMNGMADFEDVMEELQIEPGEDQEADFETLNGFLISLIDKIPNDDEVYQATAYGYLFEILSVENKMVKLVKVTRLSEETEQAEAKEEEEPVRRHETIS